MNAAQQRYADADATIGEILEQIDAHYDDCPVNVQVAYDRMGATQIPFGCHIDSQVLDDCVFETMRIQDCYCAKKLFQDGKTKPTDCEYWKPISLNFKR